MIYTVTKISIPLLVLVFVFFIGSYYYLLKQCEELEAKEVEGVHDSTIIRLTKYYPMIYLVLIIIWFYTL